MAEDWFENLEKDLEEIRKGYKSTPIERRGATVKVLAETFFNIWIVFKVDIGKEMSLTPWQWELVTYEGEKHWNLKENFNFSKVSEVILEDKNFAHAQTLRADFYSDEGKTDLRISFNLQDRTEKDREIFTSYTIYDTPLHDLNTKIMISKIQKLVFAWHESHVAGDQDAFWDHVKNNYVTDIEFKKRAEDSAPLKKKITGIKTKKDERFSR